MSVANSHHRAVKKLTPRQRVLKKYPRATVYVMGDPLQFTIYGSDGRSRRGAHWLSNKQLCPWMPTKAEAWIEAAKEIK